MVIASAETLFARAMGLIDRTVPAAFQLLEWLLVVSALRWAADSTNSSLLNFIALSAQLLLAVYVTRRLGAAGLLTFPGFETHGKPVRLIAAWVSAAMGALIMANLATSAISQTAQDLFVLNEDAQTLLTQCQAKPIAPPCYPPETPEKTVNVAGGQ